MSENETNHQGDSEELIKAARIASEPLDWTLIGEYFDTQRALVAPRETRDNSATKGDS
jgi:hypothetical protein